MEKVVIEATKRLVIGKQVGALRRDGKLPAVIYGHHMEATPITLGLREASRILATLTGSSLVMISLDGKEHSCLVKEKQRDFIRGTLKHVDFQVVSLTEKIRARVSIEFVGVSPAVKDFNGVVVNGTNNLQVESFPQDLPQRVTVDISPLLKIGDGIFVRDIDLGDKVQILDNLDEMIVVITAPKEEVEEVVEPTGVEEPEVIEKGKKEEEAEGAEEGK